ncbi:hypothetical protein RSAG8_04589, partial [Rhizoctonia solani AG-8 WAC10335]
MREIPESFSSLITIWNWMSGQIVTSTKVLGYSFAFLSEDTFLVPPPIPASGYPAPYGDSHPLALYTCSGVPPGSPARHIAQFHFPTPGVVQLHDRRFGPSPLPSVWGCSIPPASPPRVYDTSPTSHYVALDIGFSDLSRGLLFIHSSSLLSLVDIVMMDHGNCLSVPWSKWSPIASWIYCSALSHRWIHCRVFGHLVTCLSHGDDQHDWEVGIYDLRTPQKKALPKLQPDVGPTSPKEQIEHFLSNGSMSLQYPLLVKSFSIPVEVIPWDGDWYDTTDHQCGVDLLVDDEHSESSPKSSGYYVRKNLDSYYFQGRYRAPHSLVQEADFGMYYSRHQIRSRQAFMSMQFSEDIYSVMDYEPIDEWRDSIV